MKIVLPFVFATLFSINCFSQGRILVYHETNQFRHGSINAGLSMFEDLGNENGDWITDNSQDSSVFNDANLAQYDVVVFLNTSGSDESGSDGDLLNTSEKLAFENFIASGKGFIGVHAATDTYRDGVWPFYNELVGGIVQTSPNHTSNNFNADMQVITSHPIIDFLGAPGAIWNKDEEYYYWEINGGQLSMDNTVLLEVESTGSNSYDTTRPITWYKESITYDDDNNASTSDVTLSGFRSFYTALGHNSGDYGNNSNFRTLLKNATLWAIGETLTIPNEAMSLFKLYPNPTLDTLHISVQKGQILTNARILNQSGQIIFSQDLNPVNDSNNTYSLNINHLSSGLYILELETRGVYEWLKFVIK